MNSNLRKGLTLLLIALVAMSVGPASAAAQPLNYTDGDAPNPYISTDVTIDDYSMADMDDPLSYYDDSGDVAVLPGSVNSSTDVDDLGNGHVNPYTMTATDIDFGGEAAAFPRTGDADGDVSILNASEWSTTNASVANSTTAPGVDALQYDSGTDETDDAATFDLASANEINDAEKRYVQVVADISSASGTPTMTVYDTDGDTVSVELYNATADQSSDTVLANATGEGHVLQVAIGDLTVGGSGDGTMTTITKVDIQGDITMTASLINVEKKGEYVFGEKYTNTDTADDDDDLETAEITAPHGEFSINSLDTMGPEFDDAHIMGLTMPIHVEASELADENVKAEFGEDANYPQWDSVANIHQRLTLPDAYDLSFANAELRLDQGWAESRYATLRVAEDPGTDVDFADLEDTDFSDASGSLTSEGETVTLDDTIQTGVDYVINTQLLLTGDEASAMQSTSSDSSEDAGGAGIFGGSGGGIWNFFTSIPGMALGAVTALFAQIRWDWVGKIPGL